jgi:hypothetical protein
VRLLAKVDQTWVKKPARRSNLEGGDISRKPPEAATRARTGTRRAMSAVCAHSPPARQVRGTSAGTRHQNFIARRGSADPVKITLFPPVETLTLIGTCMGMLSPL